MISISNKVEITFFEKPSFGTISENDLELKPINSSILSLETLKYQCLPKSSEQEIVLLPKLLYYSLISKKKKSVLYTFRSTVLRLDSLASNLFPQNLFRKLRVRIPIHKIIFKRQKWSKISKCTLQLNSFP